MLTFKLNTYQQTFNKQFASPENLRFLSRTNLSVPRINHGNKRVECCK